MSRKETSNTKNPISFPLNWSRNSFDRKIDYFMFPRKFSDGSIGQVSGKTGSPEYSGITIMAAKCHVIPKQRPSRRGTAHCPGCPWALLFFIDVSHQDRLLNRQDQVRLFTYLGDHLESLSDGLRGEDEARANDYLALAIRFRSVASTHWTLEVLKDALKAHCDPVGR